MSEPERGVCAACWQFNHELCIGNECSCCGEGPTPKPNPKIAQLMAEPWTWDDDLRVRPGASQRWRRP